ncbi:MAG: hypothetical protein SGBAC_003540 [Bacillariaceae sp.]
MSQITESSGPIQERESSNILKTSLRNAAQYLKHHTHQTRTEAITLTIPEEFLEGGNKMPIDTVELKRQCELYVKNQLEKSFRMSNPDIVVQQKDDDADSSSTAPVEVVVDDDGSIRRESRDRKKPKRRKLKRQDTDSTTPTSSPPRSVDHSTKSYEKPDPPSQHTCEPSLQDPFIQSREWCKKKFNDLSRRSLRMFDDQADRYIGFLQRLTKRQLMYIAAGLFLFIVIIAVIGVTTGAGSQESEVEFDGPTEPPSFDLFSGSGEYLRAILDEMEPIQKDAFNWLKNIDSWEPPRDAANINQLWIERYTLAALYFSTSETKWKNEQNWISDKSVCSFGDHAIQQRNRWPDAKGTWKSQKPQETKAWYVDMHDIALYCANTVR